MLMYCYEFSDHLLLPLNWRCLKWQPCTGLLHAFAWSTWTPHQNKCSNSLMDLLQPHKDPCSCKCFLIWHCWYCPQMKVSSVIILPYSHLAGALQAPKHPYLVLPPPVTYGSGRLHLSSWIRLSIYSFWHGSVCAVCAVESGISSLASGLLFLPAHQFYSTGTLSRLHYSSDVA